MLVKEMSSENEWTAYLESTPAKTFYHSLKWKEVIEKSFRYTPLYMTARNANGLIVGVCPGFVSKSQHIGGYCSMPHSECGGPLVAEDYAKQFFPYEI